MSKNRCLQRGRGRTDLMHAADEALLLRRREEEALRELLQGAQRFREPGGLGLNFSSIFDLISF